MVFVFVLGAFVAGLIGLALAGVRGHTTATGFWLGALLGPVGWLLLLVLRPGVPRS